MLDFTVALGNAFLKDNTRSYWLLKLYYGDESSFTGFSDQPREVDSNAYQAWISIGKFNQYAGINDFTVSNGTISVKLPNTPKSVEGERFSDLFDSQYYSNRKWELIQCDEGAAYSANNMIASGIIGTQFDHTDLTCTLYLNDWWVLRNDELPIRRAYDWLYTSVPEKNIDKPIPIWYGDFDTDSAEPPVYL